MRPTGALATSAISIATWRDVGCWPLADIPIAPSNVCFQGQSGHGDCTAKCPLSTIRRHGQWRFGIGLRHGQCLGCVFRGRISARRGRHLVLDVPLDRLRFCNVLGHLFLLGSELLLRGGKMLLLGSELLYAAPQDGEISCHSLKLLHQFRRHCGRGGRGCSLSDGRWLRWRILQRHLTDRRKAGLLFGNGDVVRRLRGRELPDKRGCDTDQSRYEKVSQSEGCSPAKWRPVARQLIASRYEKARQSEECSPAK